uniref:UTP6 small subunit processome component n=1 Tax=Cyclopterus lumpus TaxID=8103 RepID=A0A8C2WQ22_CYCLU
MAEIVQHRIEERIPELEQLERVGLFTKKEVKSIIKRATALEYKLHRLVVNKEDFIAYIQYEINVLELTKKRRAHIHYQFKREEIEFPVIHRINSVFRRATNKWKDDVQLWLSHVAFCKKWVRNCLTICFKSLWIMAAKSELEDRSSSESARHLFLRTLRFHPDNKKVFQEYFRMELLHCEKLRKQKSELEKAEMDLVSFSPEILAGKLADVVYRDATAKIKEAEFVISLLNIAAIFDFTKELQDFILQDLQTNYTADSLTWDFMAKRELEAPGAGEELQTAKGRASDINRREERCCQVYEEGVKSLSAGRCSDTQGYFPKGNNHGLGLKFLQCEEKKKTFYFECRGSCINAEGAAGVATAATRRYSQSAAMWSLSLRTLMQLGSGDVGGLFQEALAHVNPKESLPLWQLQVQWSAASQSPEETDAVFQRGLLSAVAAVAMAIKESYLDWSYSTGGYKKARRNFTSLQENRPLSKAFFTRMIEIEKEQETPRMSSLRDYYERALQEFATSDDDLWLQYIQEELGPLGQPENCSKIHWRAMKFLEGPSVESFTSKYTLMQTGHL